MSDLISREWVLKEIRALRAYAQSFCQVTYATGYMCGLSGLEGRLADAPAVDAVPVVRSEWVKEEDRANHWHCKRCGFVMGMAHYIMNYCPNCGAKMDSNR